MPVTVPITKSDEVAYVRWLEDEMAAFGSVRSTLSVAVDGLDEHQRTRLVELIEQALVLVTTGDDVMVLGWTRSSLEEALNRLNADNGSVQAAVIREALRKGGYVTRDRVYKIGKYPKDRMLRGFTRPINRIVADMKAEGLIPEDAADLLAPSYQDGVVADGFTVTAALATLLD